MLALNRISRALALSLSLWMGGPALAAPPAPISPPTPVASPGGPAASAADPRIKAAPPQYLSYAAFGDSITAGCCVVTDGNQWVKRLGSALGVAPTNKGISGSLIQDTFPQIYPTAVSDTASQLYTVGIGTNEGTFSGNATTRQATFQSEHQAALAWLAVPARDKLIGQAQTQTVSVSSITSAAASGGAGVAGIATVTTSSPHGFTTGQGITITGATPTDYNVTAPITVTSTTTFTYLLKTNPAAASGTITATLSRITYAGTWAADTADYGGAMSMTSTTNGSTATFPCFGPVCYLAYGLAVNDPGTFSVTVDGNAYGTYATAGNGGNGASSFFNSPVVGVNHGSALARLSGLANTTHTIVVTVTSATGTGNDVWVDWVGQPGGSSYLAGPTVLAMGPPRNAAGETTQFAQLYALLEQQDVGVLAGDGLNVLYADSAGNTSPGADLNPDGTHPTDQGHLHMFEAAYTVLNTASTGRGKSAYAAALNSLFTGPILSGAAYGNSILNSGPGGNNVLGGGYGSANKMNGSGNNNTITGGAGNTIGSGGTNNTNSNFIGGGNQNVAQFGGQNFDGAGALNALQGFRNANCAGQYNKVYGSDSAVCGGAYGSDRSRYAWVGFGSGAFGSASGSNQHGAQILRGTGTTAAAIRLTSDGAAAGSANVMNLPAAAVGSYSLRIRLMALDITTPANTYSWTVPIAILQKTGTAQSTTALTLGTPVTLATNGWAPTVAATADTTNGGLNISFTPPSGNTDTIRVNALVEALEDTAE